MTAANPASAVGHVTVGVVSSRMARSSDATKTAAPAMVSLGPSIAPTRSEKSPNATIARAVPERGEGWVSTWAIGPLPSLGGLLDLDRLERLDVRAGRLRLACRDQAVEEDGKHAERRENGNEDHHREGCRRPLGGDRVLGDVQLLHVDPVRL